MSNQTNLASPREVDVENPPDEKEKERQLDTDNLTGRIDAQPATMTPRELTELREQQHVQKLQNRQYDNAFWLIVGTLVALLVVWIVGNIFSWPQDPLSELFKTVVTTSLGFYLGRNYGSK